MWIGFWDRSKVEEVSGQGLVPVIEHDGAVVTDSLAILRHLEERHPEHPLFPADPRGAWRLDVFLDSFDHVWKVRRTRSRRKPSRTAELGAVMDGHLDLFERMLQGRDYLMGDTPPRAAPPTRSSSAPLGHKTAAPTTKGRVPRRAAVQAAGRPRLAKWILPGSRNRCFRGRAGTSERTTSARCTASALLRTSSLRYSALVCSFTVCGERCRRAAISRLGSRPTPSGAAYHSGAGKRGTAGSSGLEANTVRPLPTARAATGASAATRVLGDEPGRTRSPGALGEIQPAPEISSTRVRGDSRRSDSHSSAPDYAEEEVHQRHVRLVAAPQIARLVAVVRGQAALYPVLLGEERPKTPVDDVVVVDHEHPQASAAHRPACPVGTTRRTRHSPSPASPNSTTPPRSRRQARRAAAPSRRRDRAGRCRRRRCAPRG